MSISDIVCDIIIPILTAILSGILGGLFTFLGVKMTINHERKTREEDLKIKMEEQKRQEIEKTLNRNKKIIQTRPELTITLDNSSIKTVEEFCLLPYIKPKLLNEDSISFEYSNEIFTKEFWDKYEIILQNTGNRAILTAFLQVPYQSDANIYKKSELLNWKSPSNRNYYNDESLLHSNIQPAEKIKIIVYFPKKTPRLGNISLDLYMHDEDSNYWYQQRVNCENNIESKIISPDAFYMHLQKAYYFWYVYDAFYWSNYVKKCFNKEIKSLLSTRKTRINKRTDEHDKFVIKVNKGEIALNYKLPLD